MSFEESTSPASEVSVSTEAAAPSTETVATSTTSDQTSAAPVATPEKPAYTPNYKFKYPKLDSNDQVEAEFDEIVKGLVNDKNEAHFRDLYTKAHGMDFFKQKYSKLSEQYKGVEPIVKTWNTLTQQYNQGDLDGFFEGIKLPKEKLFEYVLEKLNEQEMPLDQRQKIEQQKEVQRRALYLEQQNQELQSKYQTEMVQVRQFQLDQTLKSPEASSAAQSFDARVGKPGAFRDEVIKRGVLAYQATGQDISPEQAVQEVLSLIGHTGQTGMSQPGMMPQSQGQPNGAYKQSPPVIPNVGARGSSPVKRSPKSLAELKKLAETM